MKILQVPQQKLKELASDVAQSIESAPGLTLQQKYNALRRSTFRLQQQLDALLHANDRDDVELERSMQQVREFVQSMTKEEGAVVCGNLYTRQFLELDNDPRFVVSLTKYLVECFSTASILIEPQFRLWEHYANK